MSGKKNVPPKEIKHHQVHKWTRGCWGHGRRSNAPKKNNSATRSSSSTRFAHSLVSSFLPRLLFIVKFNFFFGLVVFVASRFFFSFQVNVESGAGGGLGVEDGTQGKGQRENRRRQGG